MFPDDAMPDAAGEEITGHDLRQVIRSPEQVSLDLPVAGPASRMLAYAVDYIVIGSLQVALIVALLLGTPLLARLQSLFDEFASAGKPPNAEQLLQSTGFLVAVAAFLLLQAVIEWGYFVLSETVSNGRSIGKRAIRLRVVHEDGTPVSFGASLVRNLLRMVDMLPMNYLVGLVAMVVSPLGQRLGDAAAGTIVIRLDRPEAAPPVGEGPGDGEPFRFEHAHVERLGDTEMTLIRQTLRRLESVPVDQRAALLARSVEALRARLGYEPVDPPRHEAFLRALLRAARLR